MKTLRVVLYKSKHTANYIAECLDFRLLAVGNSVGEAIENFKAVYAAMVALGTHRRSDPFAHLGPGRKSAEKAFAHARPLKPERLRLATNWSIKWDNGTSESCQGGGTHLLQCAVA